jgi:acyl-ACP thioesterase
MHAMADAASPDEPTALSPILARPDAGRSFTTSRRVRLGDVAPTGRLRLDAAARYLQDVAGDDATQVMGTDAFTWIIRRTTLEVQQFPRFDEVLALTTWGSATGSRWAERRTSIVGEDGGRIEAAALWVYVDGTTGRPKRLDDDFLAAYAASTGGRTVGARLVHGDPPAEVEPGPPWSIRRTDLDLFGHVNNAVFWSIAEEAWPVDELALPWSAEVEHRDGLEPGQQASVALGADRLWITGDGVVAATLVSDRALRPGPSAPSA